MPKPVSPQKLLEALPASASNARSARLLTRDLGLADSEAGRLLEWLDLLVLAGMAGSRAGRYWRKRPRGLLIGTLRGTRSGDAFVVPADPAERERGDLHIHERGLDGGLHDDTVIARVTGSSERGRRGLVEAVLLRANPTIVGRFIKLRSENIVSPYEERFLHEVSVGPDDSMGASDGDVVNAEIVRPPVAGRPPIGRVIEVLGQESTPGIDVEIIIRKHQLPFRFSERAESEAQRLADEIGEADLAGRLDLRGEVAVTIDGETARDFDDAVSLRRTGPERYQLGVHIADVSHYVTPGTALDEEAFSRGTSVYFPERAIPMLPERLSNGICSLNPVTDRLTVSVLMELDQAGKLLDYRLAPTVIHSRARMTYTAVNEIISGGEMASAHEQVAPMILEMHALVLALIRRREERGAIDFELPEAEVVFDDEGQICGIVRSERNIAHRLIEEFMLLANETVAVHLERLGVPSLFRVHEEPNISRVEEFAEIAASFGHKFSMHGPVPQVGFQRLSREVRGLPEERLLSYLMLRSMQRARYSHENRGHFGLAMRCYTHFTSPIRRYPDLVVHRILKEVIAHGRRGSEGWQEIDPGTRTALEVVDWDLLDEERESELRRELEPIAEHSSARERAAADAERELIEWRKVELMTSRVGEEFEGVITSVTAYGFFVELLELFVEGLVHISTLGDESYRREERKHRLVGERSGRVFRLGDIVRVQVVRVDRVRRLIDFEVQV